MRYKRGKKPASGGVALAFATIFDPSKLPPVPMEFGHYAQIGTQWGMLANDKVGDCVICDAAHQTMLWSRIAERPLVYFNNGAVLADYSAVAGFDPRDPDNTDNGTDMSQMASYRRNIGVQDAYGGRHKVDAYVSLDAGNADELAAAAYFFGAASVGVWLPDAAEDQFDNHQPWTVQPGPRPEDGHCITCVGRKANGNFVFVTWGGLAEVTPNFIAAYMDEGICFLSSEMLIKNASVEGFDVARLQEFLAAL